jgi:hypothetical protein
VQMPTARTCVCALVIAFAPSWALAAQWKQIAKGPGVQLSVDEASIKRNEGQVLFEYRIDYAKPERELGSGAPYRSTVTRAMVRCATRTISIGPTTAYAGSNATGKVVGKYPPTPDDARFQPVERGSSDENLWRHVCQVAAVAPVK